MSTRNLTKAAIL